MAGWTFDPSWDAQARREWCKKYIREIRVSNDAIEGCTIRIPQSTGLPVFGCGERLTWTDLLGFNPRSRKAVDKAKLADLEASVAPDRSELR